METQPAEKAEALEAAGVRDAAILEAGGQREAAALDLAGRRDAAILSSAGQRNVNLLWERTQMRIALAVVACTMAANLGVVVSSGVELMLRGATMSAETAAIISTQMQSSLSNLSNMGMLVIGFYFGRTNHTKQGGVASADADR
jgi:regulator of protease activity HflC (stomatin/prohibitin superfamily)